VVATRNLALAGKGDTYVEVVIDGVVVGVASFAAQPGSTEISAAITAMIPSIFTSLPLSFNTENMVLLLYGKQ
jgi:hypothetical protein